MRIFAAVLFAAGLFAAGVKWAQAMPPFAEAYAANCTLCHTQVPTLNAYGRYVQRSGYTALDRNVLKRAVPLWVGANPSYDSQDPNAPHRLLVGNVAVHAVGYLATDWTYHVQQWITQHNQAGGLDTAWVAYNNLFHHEGHLFIGKIESAAPSPFSQWSDLASFGTPEIVVGEHPYQLDANRWGSRFAFVRGSLDAEVGWLGSGDDLGGTSEFSNIDKTVQWKVADANPKRPLEFGAFGSRGAFPLPEGGTDQYRSIAAYVQRDPTSNFPGVLLVYQSAFDSNAGNGNGSAASTAATAELYRTILNQQAVIGVRKEFSNDGLGTQLQSGNIDFEYQVARFVHAYVEVYMAQNAKPGYRYMLWWTTPLSRPLQQ